MSLSKQAKQNRRAWDAYSDKYQSRHSDQLTAAGWGVWQIQVPGFLGDLPRKAVLELGCGGAQQLIGLAEEGAGRLVGIDLSEKQLSHARANLAAAGVEAELVHGSAESLPFDDASFDLVFCDHGAMSFADPRLTVPEVATRGRLRRRSPASLAVRLAPDCDGGSQACKAGSPGEG